MWWRVVLAMIMGVSAGVRVAMGIVRVTAAGRDTKSNTAKNKKKFFHVNQ